ncbi:hypothetical protein [Paenibacillus eucommiae]|uniref:Uncharacterized protein n=1 Tax=Paenibacillus eucommiae TaxID=1355755 RepID=A0ABS4J411_9BACL|nr:hypothetical protein [Paenibacillus eucommiae]MBP1993961.1 hypothetical protein [Paenibacillus eucommiae]
MTIKDKVYCVECKTILERSQAEVIFRTGFYKVTIPLAHCKACIEKDKSTPHEHMNQQSYFGEYESSPEQMSFF